jgi:hypothetical protein
MRLGETSTSLSRRSALLISGVCRLSVQLLKETNIRAAGATPRTPSAVAACHSAVGPVADEPRRHRVVSVAADCNSEP